MERKGALRGGHYDLKRSRIRWVKIRRENQGKLGDLEEKLEEIRVQTLDFEQKISGIVGEIERMEGKQRQLKSTLDSLKSDLKRAEVEESTVARTLETKVGIGGKKG